MVYLFILKSQLPSTKMMMTTVNNDTDDSDNNDSMIVIQCKEFFFQSAILTYFRPARLITLRHVYIYHRRQVV